MNEAAYLKEIRYYFIAGGEDWYITDIGPDRDDPTKTWVFVEEARKNGQEDTHMCGGFCFETGEWIEKCNLHYGEDRAIAAYVRTNGLPKENAE